MTGTKKPCGQGGCGGCTVVLSDWPNGKVRHRAINSCLRRLCSLNGLAVTTIEGTGSVPPQTPAYLTHRMAGSRSGPQINAPVPAALIEVADQTTAAITLEKGRKGSAGNTAIDFSKINPVAHRLAVNNGSQCGYCSVGFVMNMSEFITNNPTATKQEIEDAFDGNLCRCTGYRPILTGMKTMASDWSKQDQHNAMHCLEDPEIHIPDGSTVKFPVPATPPAQPQPLVVAAKVKWFTPTNMRELAVTAAQLAGEGVSFRFIHGGTSYGIYKEEFEATDAFVDLRFVEELQSPLLHPERDGVPPDDGFWDIPATTTYGEFQDFYTYCDGLYGGKITGDLYSIDYMVRRTAGRIVRNAATIGGNIMLFIHHIAKGTGEPFPSDIATALYSTPGYLEYYEIDLSNGDHNLRTAKDLLSLIEDIETDPGLASRIVLANFHVPLINVDPPSMLAVAQKVAIREVNSHSIVNCKLSVQVLENAPSLIVAAFGGINSSIWSPSSLNFNQCFGNGFTYDALVKACTPLYAEVKQALLDARPRMVGLPDDGFTEEYKAQLAIAMFVKGGLHLLIKAGASVPDSVKSAGEITWGTWGVSDGRQDYVAQDYKAPVAKPYIKSTALAQTSGRTHYTHELAYPQGTLHAAFVQSTRALGRFSYHRPNVGAVTTNELSDYLRAAFPAFQRLITCLDIPSGGLNLQGMALDQPLFADGSVHYVGQSIALVLATNEQDANSIAQYVSENCLTYEAIDWPSPWQEPVLTLGDAISRGSIYPDTPSTAPFLCHIWKITRPRSRFDWLASTTTPSAFDQAPVVTQNIVLDGASCMRVVNNQKTGGQAHFYMETQACLAIPSDEGRIVVNSATQSPMEMQQTVAMALGVQYNKVKLQTRLLGGAFGGKTEQARFVTGPTAVAAAVMDTPVRLAMSRDADTAMIGKRHALSGEGQIAVDDGSSRSEDKGVIKGMHLSIWADGGAYYDCSYVVTNCIQTRIDNAYMIDNFESRIDVCRTNTAPNTAMRAFGDVQAKNILENLVDDAAEALGMRPEALREKNFYFRGDVTPYGQTLTACYIAEVWNYLKNKCDFDKKLREVQSFNRMNKWRKRGISIIPVKYGSGYNFEQLKQSSAIVVVNQADGSIIVHQGGVDMGQGLLTQALQVAAYVLNIPMSLIHIESPQTDTTPNTSSSGASTGTPYSAEAVKRTCEQLRSRLMEFGYELLKDNGNDWCRANGVDFWNYGETGWSAEVVVGGRKSLIWQNLVQLAYVHRLSLTATFNVDIEHGDFEMPVLTFKQPDDQPEIPGITRAAVDKVTDVQNQFVGFTYSAACSVVDVDILTGETKILSSDVVYDIGWSLNPALDVGQIEGAFVQGIGFLMTEELVFQPEGEEKGRLNTVNTWRYKIPAHVTIPLEFNVSLFPRNDPSVVDIPPDDQGIFSAKEVGEPPLVLANSVFFAIKDAVRESRRERGLSTLFNLRVPATVQEVRKACEVALDQLAS